MSYRASQDGMYQRGHQKQASSLGGGDSWGQNKPLTLEDTLKLQLKFAQTGLLDSVKVRTAIDKLSVDVITSSNLTKSSLLQLVTLLSALLIKPLIAKATAGSTSDPHSSAHATSSIVLILFNLIWLWPLAGVATYYSGLLRPAQETDRRGGGRNAVVTGGAAEVKGIVAGLATECYRPLILANYFVVVYVLRFVPILGPMVGFVFACLVDSYYLFENHWLRNNWSLAERIKNVETRWAYHLGFGLPITFASWWCADPVANLSIFALLFPLVQLLTPPALPLPLDPNSPASGAGGISFAAKGKESFSMAAAEGGEEARGRKGHPSIPARLPVLWPAEKVYDAIRGTFAGVGVGGGKKKDAGGYGSGGSGSYGGGGGYGGGAGYAGGASGYGASSGVGGYGAPAAGGYGFANDPYGAQNGAGYGQQSNFADPASFAANPAYAPQPPYASPPHAPAQHAPAQAPPPANGGWRSDYGAGGPAVVPPPRSGYASTGAEGYAGSQGVVVDRGLDRLIGEASRRRKAD